MSRGKRRGSKPLSVRARELPTPKPAPVVVKYVCPICGGQHAKQDHPKKGES